MTLPLPDLHDKDFEKFVEEMKASLPRFSHQWTNFNPSDPGIAILELLAWSGDGTLYRLNRIPWEAYFNFLRFILGVYGLNSLMEKLKRARNDSDFEYETVLLFLQKIELKLYFSEILKQKNLTIDAMNQLLHYEEIGKLFDDADLENYFLKHIQKRKKRQYLEELNFWLKREELIQELEGFLGKGIFLLLPGLNEEIFIQKEDRLKELLELIKREELFLVLSGISSEDWEKIADLESRLVPFKMGKMVDERRKPSEKKSEKKPLEKEAKKTSEATKDDKSTEKPSQEPSHEEIQRLIEETFSNLHRAFQSGEFNNFHKSLSRKYQASTTSEKLKESFQDFISHKKDLSFVKEIDPEYESKFNLQRKTMSIRGNYTTSLDRLNFRLRFTFENNEWKLDSIFIDSQPDSTKSDKEQKGKPEESNQYEDYWGKLLNRFIDRVKKEVKKRVEKYFPDIDFEFDFSEINMESELIWSKLIQNGDFKALTSLWDEVYKDMQSKKIIAAVKEVMWGGVFFPSRKSQTTEKEEGNITSSLKRLQKRVHQIKDSIPAISQEDCGQLINRLESYQENNPAFLQLPDKETIKEAAYRYFQPTYRAITQEDFIRQAHQANKSISWAFTAEDFKDLSPIMTNLEEKMKSEEVETSPLLAQLIQINRKYSVEKLWKNISDHRNPITQTILKNILALEFNRLCKNNSLSTNTTLISKGQNNRFKLIKSRLRNSFRIRRYLLEEIFPSLRRKARVGRVIVQTEGDKTVIIAISDLAESYREEAFLDQKGITLTRDKNQRREYEYLLSLVEHFLESRRLLGTTIDVKKPAFEKVKLSIKIAPHIYAKVRELRDRVKRKIQTFLDALGGGQKGEGWPYGRSLTEYELAQVIERVKGVKHITNLSMWKYEEPEVWIQTSEIPTKGLLLLENLTLIISRG